MLAPSTALADPHFSEEGRGGCWGLDAWGIGVDESPDPMKERKRRYRCTSRPEAIAGRPDRAHPDPRSMPGTRLVASYPAARPFGSLGGQPPVAVVPIVRNPATRQTPSRFSMPGVNPDVIEGLRYSATFRSTATSASLGQSPPVNPPPQAGYGTPNMTRTDPGGAIQPSTDSAAGPVSPGTVVSGT